LLGYERILTLKTYGEISFAPGGSGAKRSSWLIKADPHVAIKIKRILAQVESSRAGTLMVTDTPETARDLEWIMDRYPMRMDSVVAGHLAARSKKHKDAKEAIFKILDGQRLRDLGNEPVRTPWVHQAQAADVVLTTGGLLLGDSVGLGKSLASLLTLRNPAALPALVVTLTHLPRQWMRELHMAYPWMRGHVLTSTTPYQISKRREMGGHEPDVIFTNYHKLDGWAPALTGEVKTVLFDEMQELRHDGSKKYVAAAQIADAATYRMGMTATPVYNYGIEMFNILDLLFPGALGSRAEFKREWCVERGNKTFVKDPDAFGTYLREEGFFLRRTRKDLGMEIPETVRIPHIVDSDSDKMGEISAEISALAETVLSRVEGNHEEVFKASGQLDWRLRRQTGLAKAPYVADFVRLLLESEERVLLLGWHRDVYDIWMDKLKEFHPVMYTGSESPTKKNESVQRFMREREADPEAARVLIMSLRSGAGLDGLEDYCRVIVFGELDWSPSQHLQAIGRLERGAIKESPTAYFLISEEGSDPLIAETLNVKRMQSEPMVDPGNGVIEVVDPGVGADRIKRLAKDYLRQAGR
jgi:SNF2 family DNA or RNA helicase